MRILAVLALLLLALPACSTVDHAIWRAQAGENIKNIWKGKDRGVNEYASTIDQYTSSGYTRGRYVYVNPAYTSNFRVGWAVLGLGRTETKHPDQLALVTDRLFHTLARDPTGTIRASTCEQLGKVLGRLRREGETTLPPVPEPGPHADAKINQVAKDLMDMQAGIEEGKRLLQSDVVERIAALAAQRPTTARSSTQMIRALSARPIAGVAPGAVRNAADVAIPVLVRDCVQITLREMACGQPSAAMLPDPDPFVRRYAIRALTTGKSGVAVGHVARRLNDSVDPFERDPEVRRELVDYLGEIGGDVAFDACVRLVGDLDSGVRFHAQRALRRMTGTDDIAPTERGWHDWRKKHPEWGRPAEESSPE